MMKRKVKYIGNMETGLIHTSEGKVFGNRNEWVEVSKEQFDEIVPAKSWEGDWSWKKKKKEVKE